MDNLNDLLFFSAVVQHQGFSAASRATHIEKTRLSRRVAALEQRLGVRLLQRSTRTVTLTEAGKFFYEHCQTVVDGARAAYDSISELKKEPTGNIRVSCPILLAQNYLAPILPGYMALHPKVSVFIDSTDRAVNLLEERYDLALRARSSIENSASLVAKVLGSARRILVASPVFLRCYGYPQVTADLAKFDALSSIADLHDSHSYWLLKNTAMKLSKIKINQRIISGDLQIQLEAALHGIGIALLPEPIVAPALKTGLLEQVLPDWSAAEHTIHLVYPAPRGMLPSVRSLIDYLLIHIPASLHKTKSDLFPIQS